MTESRACPLCHNEVGAADVYCKHCDADLEKDDPAKKGNSHPGAGKKEAADQDEFSELDYRPPKKLGIMVPILVIMAVLVIFAGVALILRDYTPAPVLQEEADTPEEETAEKVPADPEPEVVDPEPAEDEEEEVEEEEEPMSPPEYDRLEDKLKHWLVGRTGDPQVIMYHTEEINEMDDFFEKYDLDQDNVIVYEIEAKDEQYVSVLFGLPFSEWSIRAVFAWNGWEWVFLREDTVG